MQIAVGLVLLGLALPSSQDSRPAPGAPGQHGEQQGEPRLLFAGLADRLEQPQLAVRADGAVALLFVADHRGVRVALREPGKTAWSEPALAFTVPDLALGMHRGPRVAWAGNVLVCAYIIARFDPKLRKMLGPADLFVRRSLDQGRTWSEPLVVNGEHGSAAEGLHALAARGDDVVVAWLDPRGSPRGKKLYFARSRDGGRTFGREVVAYVSPSGSVCECCHPCACLDEDGSAVLLWRNHVGEDRDMYVGRIGREGRELAAVQPAGTEHWQLNACPMDGGALALGPGGVPMTIWRRGDEVLLSIMPGREQLLGKGRNPVLALCGNDGLAVWEEGTVLRACRLAEGKAKAPCTLGEGSYAAVAAPGRGMFLIVAERRAGEHIALTSFEL